MIDIWEEITDAALTIHKDGGRELARLVLKANDRIEELDAQRAADAKVIEAAKELAEKIDRDWDEASMRDFLEMKKALAAFNAALAEQEKDDE